MAYDPTRGALACAACGQRRVLPEPDESAQARAREEHDALAVLRAQADADLAAPARVIDCPACGAQTRFEGHVVGDRCAFCASPLRLELAHDERLIPPQALLPFALDAAAAQQVFARWVSGRWFAPSALARTVTRAEGIRGVYLPWWTFDAHTETIYRGERGEHDGRGPADQRNDDGSRSAGPSHVSWTPVQGVVSVDFDDVLVVGSRSVPEHLARALDGWNLAQLQPPQPERMAGFTVEVYRRGLDEAWGDARAQMDQAIETAVRRDIGGDQQRIRARQTQVEDLRFKHLLLPVWIGSYRFGGKPYQVVVNGQTGEVEGDRPYSVAKIVGAIVGVIVLLWVLNLMGH